MAPAATSRGSPWHDGEQPSPLAVLPSSHVSSPRQSKPSPQRACLQSQLQSSWLSRLPSSHSSPASTTPSPQRKDTEPAAPPDPAPVPPAPAKKPPAPA